MCSTGTTGDERRQRGAFFHVAELNHALAEYLTSTDCDSASRLAHVRRKTATSASEAGTGEVTVSQAPLPACWPTQQRLRDRRRNQAGSWEATSILPFLSWGEDVLAQLCRKAWCLLLTVWYLFISSVNTQGACVSRC